MAKTKPKTRRYRVAFGVQRVFGGKLRGVPCLFGRRADAAESRWHDEVVVRVEYRSTPLPARKEGR